MVRVGLLVRVEARPGREQDVERLLCEGLPLVEEEPGTTVWFALRTAPSTFAIFDAFPDEAGRAAHLAGRLAAALAEQASSLLAGAPRIERADVLAAKMPAQR